MQTYKVVTAGEINVAENGGPLPVDGAFQKIWFHNPSNVTVRMVIKFRSLPPRSAQSIHLAPGVTFTEKIAGDEIYLTTTTKGEAKIHFVILSNR